MQLPPIAWLGIICLMIGVIGIGASESMRSQDTVKDLWPIIPEEQISTITKVRLFAFALSIVFISNGIYGVCRGIYLTRLPPQAFRTCVNCKRQLLLKQFNSADELCRKCRKVLG